MKIREKIVMCVASVLKVLVSLKNEEQVDPAIGKEQPQVILTDEREIKLWGELSSQLKDGKKYILLTDEADIDRWESFKANIPSDKESSPISMVAYKNLIHSLYRMLVDAENLSISTEKERIIKDIEKSYEKCGLEIVRYDGSNKDLFELKEDLEVEEIQIGTSSIRDTRTGEILITGILFIPCKK